MTQTQHPRRYALSLLAALVVISALGALAAVALTVQLGRAATPAAVPVADMHRIDAIPGTGAVPAEQDELLGAVLGGGETYTTTQAIEVHRAADRVCEGFTAQVPLVVMEPEIAREFSMDGVYAHEFVKIAHRIQCPSA